ncbi:uncharacterized protein TNIN_395061 [Trichonephila inaurata madagascariensis]|uniref:Uncharacterized protein n=1 Tax=Trichonephila inaurata madagascariensis TaxID=2747483 RepID=A0A8X6YV96_9ARAC|nr:uncharacterized protein TNIN_395061 [Trichonephila inaurata madagascariensis]
MSLWKLSILLIVSVVLLGCRGQQYDFGAEITRQCLVPDPVGLLDCVENKVTLPYLKSWVDCTNSLGQNVKTSADIINYRCKSVWEGKGVIPEVFYIKDCVIEKTGLPAKNVSAEVLGAYKECESTPSAQGKKGSTGQTQPAFLSQAPVQAQQVSAPQTNIKTAPIIQQQINPPAVQYVQTAQPVQSAPRMPPQQQPFSQQYFVIYPRPPLPIQQQFSAIPNAVTQQQLPITSYGPPPQQLHQQQVPVSFSTQLPTSAYIPQAQPPIVQQQLGKTSYSPQVQQISQYSLGSIPVQAAPSGPYSYQFQIRHS